MNIRPHQKGGRPPSSCQLPREVLVATTQDEPLADGDRGREVRYLSPEDVARMEHEMESYARELKLIEESHGRNALHLTVVTGYLKRVTENPRVVRYLAQRHPELQAEFQKRVESWSLVDGVVIDGGRLGERE